MQKAPLGQRVLRRYTDADRKQLVEKFKITSASARQSRLCKPTMTDFIQLKWKPEVLEKNGLPDILYPVPIQSISVDGHTGIIFAETQSYEG